MTRWTIPLGLLAIFLANPAGGQEPAADPPDPLPPPPPTAFRQVQMHVWISETTEQGIRDLGADLDYTRFVRGREDPSNSLQQIRTNLSFDDDRTDFSVTLPPPNPSLFPAPFRLDQNPPLTGGPRGTEGLQTQSGAGLNFSIIENGSGTIGGAFRTIEQNLDSDVISKPELLVIEGMTASIQAGDKVPFQSIQFSGNREQLVVGFKEVGVNMDVTPTIRPDNLIQLHLVKLDVTDLLGFVAVRGLELPLVSTRSQTGVVLVPNGQTLVIGGLSSRSIVRKERRVPILGRIPIVGIPFRRRSSEVKNSNLIIFVSPTIVDLREMTPTAMDALQFWQEGGWKNIGRIEEEVEAMENEL